MDIEGYKNMAKQEQQHQDEIIKLEKEVQDWQAKSCKSTKEIITLRKDMNKKKEEALRAFIKRKSKQEDLDITEKDDKIILSIKDIEKEKLYFEFTFAEK